MQIKQGTSARARNCLITLVLLAAAFASQAFVPATTSTDTSLAGATPVKLDVTNSGSASIEVPIQVVPGTAGMQPDLALAYDSLAGNGVAGVGWSLRGLSVISRCARTLAADGAAGRVALDANDRYCMDGHRLVAISGADGADQTEYRTEIESDIKVVSYGMAGIGPAFFRVWLANGQIAEYGSSASSRIEAIGSAGVVVWALHKVRDRKGNYQEVTYNEDNANGHFAPARIDYSGYELGQVVRAPYASVRFVYASRSDVEVGYVAGVAWRGINLLTNIRTYFGDTLVRDYRLDYAGGVSPATARSRLKAVTECTGSGACLPAVEFGWTAPGNGLTLSTRQTLVEARGGAVNNDFTAGQFQDVNGDGRADYCTDEAAAGYAHVVRCLYATEQGWSPGIMRGFANRAELVGTWADFNGDGLLDFCTVSTAQETVGPTNKVNSLLRCRINNGTELVNDVLSGVIDYGSFTRVSESGEVISTTVAAWWVDVNADGRADFCRVTSHATLPNRMQCTLSAGTAFGVTWDLGAVVRNNTEALGIWLDTGPSRTKMYCRNAALDMICSPVLDNGSFGPSFSLAGVSAHSQSVQGDVNGDGIGDICSLMVAPGNSADSVMNCYAGTGAGWVALPSTVTLGQRYPSSLQLNDINGDGKGDLCWRLTPSGAQPRLRCLLSAGTSFGSTLVGDMEVGYGPKWGDIDGDGLNDVCNVWKLTTETFIRSECWTLAPGQRDVIASVTDSLGARTEFSYAPLTQVAAHTQGINLGYPVLNAVPAMYTVSSMRIDNGMDGSFVREYRYKGFRRDQLGRGSLGFEATSASHNTTGVRTDTTYRQDPPFAGLKAGQRVVHARRGDIALLEEVTTWTAAALGGSRYRLLRDAVGTKTQDANGALTGYVRSVVQERNAYGQETLTRITTHLADGSADGYSEVSRTDYRNDSAAWLLALPMRSAVTRTLPGGSTQTRTHSADYDADGYQNLLVLEPENAGLAGVTNLRLVSSFGHDVFGNRTSVTQSGASIANRSSNTVYDEAGRFPVTVTQANGLTLRYEYDGRFGSVTRFTDANNVSTVAQPDALGRTARVLYPDGTQSDSVWRRCAGCWKGSVLYAESTHTITAGGAQAAPVQRSYADRLGRTILKQAQSFDGRLSYQEAEYDALGRQARESAPYFGGEAVYWTTYAYLDDAGHDDPFGRASRAARADGAEVSASYDGLLTRVSVRRDQGGNTVTRRTERNSRGETVRITDALGTAEESTLTYTYTPFGQLATITDALGNVIRMEYDPRGRNLVTHDPNLGTWRYAYDELSQLRSQTDAKGQTTTLEYDLLGRVTQRATPDALYRWTYDSCANGKGALCRVDSPSGSGGNGYARSHGYDALGRPGSVTVTADGSHTIGYAYDAAGRLGGITYPTGMAVQRGYNAYGHLAEVRQAGGGLLWRPTAYDAAGALTGAAYGNGLLGSHGIDPASGRVTSVHVGGSAAAEGLLNLVLQHDLQGNVLSRTEAVAGLSEGFSYDALNRLTAAAVVGGPSKTVSYDAIGNVKSKSDVGSYGYNASGAGSVRPAAIAGVSGTLNGVANPVFSYDANGNLEGGAGRSYAWLADNLPASLSGSGKTLAWLYDEAGQRIRETVAQGAATVGVTLYVGGLYEQESRAGVTEHRHYVGGDRETVAVLVSRSDGSSRVRYLHRDPLGSLALVTDAAGAVLERLGYDAFGRRRNPAGTDSAGLSGVYGQRGFTDHEHLDEVGLIHMNGRLYDPQLNRFVSADPLLQAPGYSQSPNRYMYVWGNPLGLTDPSGHAVLMKSELRGGGMPWGPSALQVGGQDGGESGGNEQERMLPPPVDKKGCLDPKKVETIVVEGIKNPPGFGTLNMSAQEWRDVGGFAGENRNAAARVSDGRAVPTLGPSTARQQEPQRKVWHLGDSVRVVQQARAEGKLKGVYLGDVMSDMGKLNLEAASAAAGISALKRWRLFYDARPFKKISAAYWESNGPAVGRSLHHWLFPQRASWVPEGIRNAGFNLIELPAFKGVFHRSLGLNQWMGFATRWGGSAARSAAIVENAIRLGVPAAAGAAGYGWYEFGSAILGDE